MEQERKNRENEERERAERMKKIKEEFNDPESQWEKDKSDIEGITSKDKETKKNPEEGDSRPAPHSERPTSEESHRSSNEKATEGDTGPALRPEKATSEESHQSGNEKATDIRESLDAKSKDASKSANKPEALVEDEDTEPRRSEPDSKANEEKTTFDRELPHTSSASKLDSEADEAGVQKKSANTKKVPSAAEPGGSAQRSRPKKLPTDADDLPEREGKQPRNTKIEESLRRAKTEKIVKADKGS